MLRTKIPSHFVAKIYILGAMSIYRVLVHFAVEPFWLSGRNFEFWVPSGPFMIPDNGFTVKFVSHYISK